VSESKCGEACGSPCGHDYAAVVTDAIKAGDLQPMSVTFVDDGYGNIVDDGYGNMWEKCGPGCHLAIVRPGKVQCPCDDDPVHYAHAASGKCIYCEVSPEFAASVEEMLDRNDEILRRLDD
jgi:hypothetical protein